MKLTSLKPRLATLKSRLRTLAPTTGYARTERDRGRPWRRRRAARLRAHPLCQSCETDGRVSAATQVDHIVPLWRGGSDDDANLQSLCEPCHVAKTAQEAAERARLGLSAKE